MSGKRGKLSPGTKPVFNKAKVVTVGVAGVGREYQYGSELVKVGIWKLP